MSNLIPSRRSTLKKQLLRGLLTALCGLAFLGANAHLNAADAPAREGQTALKGHRGRVVHVVCFKFKEAATEARIKQVVDDFAALKGKIPQIASFEWGANISPENLNKGFKHCFILTFKTPKDRDAYLVHPAHKAFGKSLGPVLADVFVIDYQARHH